MSKTILVKEQSATPLAVQIVAALNKIPIEITVDASVKDVNIKGTDIFGDAKCAASLNEDENVDAAITLASKAASAMEDFLNELNELLKKNPTVSANKLGAADAILFAALLAANFDLKQCGKARALVAKWFQSFKHNAALKSVFAPPKKATKEKSRMGTQGKRELKGYVEGMKVVTRFAPEPSGYLHIGHIKACLLSDFFAHEYNGEMILRFDDTNPAKEKQEYVDSISSDLETLRVKPVRVSFTSDYFDLMLDWARKFIKEGKAYVETQSKEVMKDQKLHKQPSKCRDQSVEENLRLFELMVQGTEEGQNYVLRAKIDYASPNGVLRDPSIYRCLKGSHYRTGDKYKVYPLYDFSTPIIDSIEGVTHALRSAEYHDRNALYNWMLEAAGVRKVVIEDFSRLNFAYVLLSKRKLQWFVDNKVVDGWNDPRFPTLRGMMRRGMTIEAMREFCTAQGASKAVNLMEMDKIWAVNKKIIDPDVPRFTAIEKESAYTLTITDIKETTSKTELRHKRNPALGKKIITITPQVYIEGQDALAIKAGEEVTLMDLGNVIIDSIDNDKKTATGHTNFGGSVKNTKKLTWLPSTNTVACKIVEFDHLITVRKLDEKQNFEDFINKNSRAETEMIGDPNLRLLNKGDKIQFERRGYFIVEHNYLPNHDVILNLIPDGDRNPAFKRKIDIKW